MEPKKLAPYIEIDPGFSFDPDVFRLAPLPELPTLELSTLPPPIPLDLGGIFWQGTSKTDPISKDPQPLYPGVYEDKIKKSYLRITDFINRLELNQYPNFKKDEYLQETIKEIKIFELQKYESKVVPPLLPMPNPGPLVKRSQDKNMLLHPEDLPELALPIIEYMRAVKPDIVIGCDRGGRLFSLAIHRLWRELYPDEPFPTMDHKIHFARVSKTENPGVIRQRIEEIVAQSRAYAGADNQEKPVVMFVDDWVAGGGTQRLAKQLTDDIAEETHFVVMRGDGADATGSDDFRLGASWHDSPTKIGINYLSEVTEGADGGLYDVHKPIAVRGPEMRVARKSIGWVAILAAEKCRVPS